MPSYQSGSQGTYSDFQTCRDISHGEGWYADYERDICKELKVLKLRSDGTMYLAHASSATPVGTGAVGLVDQRRAQDEEPATPGSSKAQDAGIDEKATEHAPGPADIPAEEAEKAGEDAVQPKSSVSCAVQ